MMAFQRDKFSDFHCLLREIQRSVFASQCATAENFLFEERLNDGREDSYEEHLKAPTDHGSWNYCHENYLSERACFKKKKGLPETFTDVNRRNFLTSLRDREDDYLVRVEKLSWPASLTGLDVNSLFGRLKDFFSDSSDASVVDKMLIDWNKGKDIRPCFAGFWDEVKDLFVDSSGKERDNDNWANELRDRFGLGHLNPRGTAPVKVLLLRYKVREVIDAVGAEAAFAVPTVLDSGLNEFFCPSPVNENFGQIVDLSSDSKTACRLSREILHQSIDWQLKHLYRVGEINRALGKNCSEARQIHLKCFGEYFKAS